MTGSPGQSARRKVKRVLKCLRASYGPRAPATRGRGVDVLVGTILSQNTNAANSSAGYRRLRKRFSSWDAAADAPVRQIERCIRVAGLGRTKAPRIRAILRQIRGDRGRVSLEHLRRSSAEAAYEYLVRFDGVGPKTALCVLLLAFGMAVFPVDTHVYRITRRLGLIDPGVAPAKAHEVLTPLIAPADRHALHVLLIAHGRATCRAQRPRCEECRLLGICDYGRRTVPQRSPGRAPAGA